MSVAAFIACQRTEHGVPHALSCRALGLSESWFYKWRDRHPHHDKRGGGGRCRKINKDDGVASTDLEPEAHAASAHAASLGRLDGPRRPDNRWPHVPTALEHRRAADTSAYETI